MNKVVARFVDGRRVKGMTADFIPGKDVFHLTEAGAPPGKAPIAVRMKDLKALFFVKDFAGNPEHVMRKVFDPRHPPAGRKIQVTFKDGEVIVGSTTGYQKGRPGFFVVPADADANTERCFIVTAATKEVVFL